MGYEKLQAYVEVWSGTIANIPKGYKLCDGTNGTPDLAALFVRGAANSQNAGGTGGSGYHYHTHYNSLYTDYPSDYNSFDMNYDYYYTCSPSCCDHQHQMDCCLSIDTCYTVHPYYDILYVMPK